MGNDITKLFSVYYIYNNIEDTSSRICYIGNGYHIIACLTGIEDITTNQYC
jgi:hypothetical protein